MELNNLYIQDCNRCTRRINHKDVIYFHLTDFRMHIISEQYLLTSLSEESISTIFSFNSRTSLAQTYPHTLVHKKREYKFLIIITNQRLILLIFI